MRVGNYKCLEETFFNKASQWLNEKYKNECFDCVHFSVVNDCVRKHQMQWLNQDCLTASHLSSTLPSSLNRPIGYKQR